MTDQIFNYHVRHSINIGDALSAPLNYFQFPGFQSTFCDIDEHPDQDRLKSQPILLGGGGLLFPRFLDPIKALQSLRDRGPHILWGVGQQTYGGDLALEFQQFAYQPYLQGADLVGIRDYFDPLQEPPKHGLAHHISWVPCASCMHPAFDRVRTPQHEIVVFSHKKFRLQIPDLPTLTNEEMDFETVLDFLGSGETILTSSFHGAYWATLLGRKVLAFPFSSKFYGLRHRPGLFPVQKWRPKRRRLALFGKTLYERFDKDWFECDLEGWRSRLGQCRSYPESLEECRDRNRWFYQEVLKRLPEP
jgi:hypothetical protein